MREFRDDEGTLWEASVKEREGENYKGRYAFQARPKEGDEGESVCLDDVRWNTMKTADRTLATMAETELRRRLKIARGRKG